MDAQRAPTSSVPFAYGTVKGLAPRCRVGGHHTPDRTSATTSARSRPPAARIAIDKLTRGSSNRSTATYAGAACQRCDGRPFVEKRKTDDEHDCVKKERVAHVGKQMAPVDSAPDSLDHQWGTYGGAGSL